MLGCRTILHLLARRSGESITFSVPDPNALWSRAEDGILVQVVVKYSTNNVLGHDWREVIRNTLRFTTHFWGGPGGYILFIITDKARAKERK